MTNLTNITVRVLAYGGKFIGSHVNYANVEVIAFGKIAASGTADQGTVPSGQDGSGDVAEIMGQNYQWGAPIYYQDAVEFNCRISVPVPTVMTFAATSNADKGITASISKRVLPGVDLTGDRAVVLVLYGLLVDLDLSDASVQQGTSVNIQAQVRMMCGCMIDNNYWPVDNFTIQALIARPDGQTDYLDLDYTGNPSYFAAQYAFQETGNYVINARAIEYNGNEGASPTQATISVT